MSGQGFKDDVSEAFRECVELRARVKELEAENHNALQALIYAIQKHPNGEVCQDWSSWRVGYGRGAHRGYGRTDAQQLVSAVCMATGHIDPYAPDATP